MHFAPRTIVHVRGHVAATAVSLRARTADRPQPAPDTLLACRCCKDDELIGSIVIYRQEARPFTDKQIELVKNFAAQAVIAIENTRLLNELRQRTDDLSESLEQQTATSEILQVISNSLSDTQPVFDAIVQSGLKLFPGALVSVALRYGDTINAAAVAAPDSARVEAWRRTISRTPLARNYMHGAALLDRRIVDIPDVADAPAEFVAGGQNFLTSGNRAITIMPMMRGDEAIGLLSVVRLVAGPLSDKQLAVLRTFANQAVIAIENTRLLNELRQRTDDLTESLEQQTATSEVLQVISSSPGELAARVRGHAGECDAHLRGQVRRPVALRRRCLSRRRGARRAAGLCRVMRDASRVIRASIRNIPLDRMLATQAGGPHSPTCGPTQPISKAIRACRARRSRRRATLARRADAQGE